MNKTNAAQQEELYTAEDICKIYEYVNLRDKSEDGFKASIARMYERNARWANPIVKGLVSCVGRLLSPSKRSVRYFFWGTKYKEIILGLPVGEVCVIGGPKQLLFCLKNRVNFIECMSVWGYFYCGLAGKERRDSLTKLMGCLWSSLNWISHENAIFIVDNDSLPAQRSLIFLFRKFGLRTICIQHGLFQSKSPGYIMDGWFADNFFALNEAQRNMLISKGMDSSKIITMGFHSSPYIPKRPMSLPPRRKVCFLGQPWFKYGKERASLYEKVVNETDELLKGIGVQMFYKPHPWEKGGEHLEHIDNVTYVSLFEAFERYDVFISLTSTALLEAAAAGRLAIQLMHELFDADDFTVHGDIVAINILEVQWGSELIKALASPVREPSKYSAVESFLKATDLCI